MSPGRAAIIRGSKLDRKAEKRKRREEKREVKRRRVELKEERRNSQSVSQIREGPTYESGIAMWHCADEKEIPPATVVPKLECLSEVDSCLHMMFDLETTSLGNNYNYY